MLLYKKLLLMTFGMTLILMQNVLTYSSHLQAKLRTVIVLQGGCAHSGPHLAYSVFAAGFLYTM